MAWPKGRPRRAAHTQRSIDVAVYDRDVQIQQEGEERPSCDGECREGEGGSQMSVTVRTPEHQGVSVEHPRIIEAIKNLSKQGRTREDIVKIVGMPGEVVAKYDRK